MNRIARNLLLSVLLTLVAVCFTGCGEPMHSASTSMSMSMDPHTHM